jgi:hypothetical protein
VGILKAASAALSASLALAALAAQPATATAAAGGAGALVDGPIVERTLVPPGEPGPAGDPAAEPEGSEAGTAATGWNPAVHLGDKFRNPNVCVQSYLLESYWGVTGAVASWNTSDMNYWIRFGDGGCAGTPVERTVYVKGYTNATDGLCAYVKRWDYVQSGTGLKTRARTEMWVNGGYPSCRDLVHNRNHVLAHEFGHAGGLSHNTFQSTVMNPSNWTYERETANDEYYLNQLY